MTIDKITYNDKYGMNEIAVDGFVLKPTEALYSNYNQNFEKTNINFIPYSCYANRGESSMLVWVNVR